MTVKTGISGARHSPAGAEVKRTQGLPITEAERRAFLRELRKHGCKAWAARAAGRRTNSFFGLEKRDAAFGRAVADALEEADGRVEAEAVRRAVEGIERYEISGGDVVLDPTTGQPLKRREYSDHLLALILRARNARYRQTQQIDVNHHHATGHHASISVDDIWALPPDKRDQLLDLLGEVERLRRGPDAEPVDGGELEVIEDYSSGGEALPVEELEALRELNGGVI